MPKPTLYFFCPDLSHPLGGIKQTYRHVDVLNANGFDAWIVHRQKGFKIEWFEHDTRVMYEPAPVKKNLDVGVFPEIWGPNISKWGKNIRRVIFNQNCYYTFLAFGPDQSAAATYLDPNVIGAIVVSDDSKQFLEYAFPGLHVYRIRYSIDPKLFYSQPKKKQICLMPRKNPQDANAILCTLRCRGALDGWNVLPIDNVSQAQAAAILRESAVFLSFGHPEGFGLPPAEALLCRCIVAGYTGHGGDEFMKPEFCFPIRFGDIRHYVQTVEQILQQYTQNPATFPAMTQNAAAFITENYSEAREGESILSCWNRILG